MITECWSQMIDVHGFGGMFRDFPTLGECQAACEKDNTCVAIDWEPSNAGKSCWFLTSTATGRTLHRGVIIHYQLDRACLSQLSLLLRTVRLYASPCSFCRRYRILAFLYLDDVYNEVELLQGN